MTFWIIRLGKLDYGAIAGIFMVLGLLLALSKKIGWRLKAMVLVASLSVSGLVFCLLVGVRYPALGTASAGIMVAAAFFGRRLAFTLIAFDFLVIISYGLAAQSGWIQPPIALLPGETIITVWLKSGISFLMVCSVLTLLISGLLESLEINLSNTLRISEISNSNEQKYRRLIDYAPEAIVVLDVEQDRFVDVNPQAEILLGYPAADLKRLSPLDVSPKKQENGLSSMNLAQQYLAQAAGGENPVFEWTLKNQEGTLIPCEIRLLRLPDNDATLIRGSITDIRERRKAQALIQSLALYDNLTGLPNRKLLEEKLQLAMTVSEQERQYGAVLFVDVDNFKNINDSSGHAAGDYFLTVVAERISGVMKGKGTVARWGGDEFIVVAENLSKSLSEAAKRAEEIGEWILSVIVVPTPNPYAKGQSFESSVSIGITLLYGHIHTTHELLKRADIAMYQAKLSGKNRLSNFDVEMQKEVEERVALEADLHQALRNNEFEMYYQAQVDQERRIVGAEILLRWKHPVRGFVFPGDFITLAEETGDIVDIGNWIIRMACTKLKEWKENPERSDLALSINVSSRQFREPGFVAHIAESIREAGIDPSKLKLELTESLMLDNIDDTIGKMGEIRDMGLSFSLDDFGTGYSSLSYLKQLPLSQLKIDQSFVQYITTDKNDAVLIRTIIGMAANLNLHVIAEGVETEEQMAALLEMGCRNYQGYYFSKPIPIVDFEKLFA